MRTLGQGLGFEARGPGGGRQGIVCHGNSNRLGASLAVQEPN